jgi:predicted oxidoreductase
MQRAILAPDFSLSRIVYGMWRLADDEDTSPGHVQAKIETCLSQGITSFDQADIYGGYTAEAVLGGALRAAPHLRDQMEIVSKCGIVAPVGRHAAVGVKHYDTTAAHISASVDQSLTDMGIDRIDLLLIHRPDPLMNHIDTGAALDGLVASGKVRHVGVSNFRPHDFTLLQSAMRTPLVTNQIEMSLLHADPFTNGDLAFLQERAIVPMAWSPLGGGALFKKRNKGLMKLLTAMGEPFGVDAAAVAIAWLMAHPAWIAPVMGTNTLARIATLADACKVTLSREDWYMLYTEATGAEVP